MMKAYVFFTHIPKSCCGSLQCRWFWWSIEWFAAILDSLQTGRIGARMTECRRGGGQGRENKNFFFPLPLPLPQFFFLSPTLGKLFTSPQLSTISRWRPEQPIEIYIHSPHQNPPALQATVVGFSGSHLYPRKVRTNPQVLEADIRPPYRVSWRTGNEQDDCGTPFPGSLSYASTCGWGWEVYFERHKRNEQTRHSGPFICVLKLNFNTSRTVYWRFKSKGLTLKNQVPASNI